jgi:ATP synthase protein I
MPTPHDPGNDPLGRLDEGLAAFDSQRRKARPGVGSGLAASLGGGGAGAADGYRLIGLMLGGVFGGVGLGWLLDHFAHTRPFGLVGGLLIGATMSIVATIRAASRMGARNETATPPPAAGPGDDEDDD